jgi:hypothetical protein
MKGSSLVLGTVLLVTANAANAQTPGAAQNPPQNIPKMNTRQVLVVTPELANAFGLSYEKLFQLLQLREKDQDLTYGGPILLRFKDESSYSVGPTVVLTIEDALAGVINPAVKTAFAPV